MKNNVKLIIITLGMYIINQIIKSKIPIEDIKWFMTCYFNDMIGGITFCAYCSIVLKMGHRQLKKLWHIEMLMFCCGIFWEYITPLYRKNTISDIFDIVAYMIGGVIYWYIFQKYLNNK